MAVEKQKKPQIAAREKHQDVELMERQRHAFEIWKSEKNADGGPIGFRDIGERLGVSHETARKDVYAALDLVTDEFEESVRQWKVKQLHKLMRKYEQFDKMSNDSQVNANTRVNAGRLCLDLIKQISELTGTKSAESHNVNVNFSDLTDEQLEAIAKSKG